MKGALTYDGGATKTPGLCALVLPSMRRGKSSFIEGLVGDAADIAGQLVGALKRAQTTASMLTA